MQDRIAPYILAGGRSTRMGRDKAMLELGGRTLLARTVETLRAVRGLGPAGERAMVTLLGERSCLEGADRAVSDGYPGCGPLGGMEAALADLERTGYAEWAFFLPVDMPFLPPTLIDALLVEWRQAARNGASACHVSVDGRAQPLVSLLHRRLHPHLREALRAGHFKVTPVLQSACRALAYSAAEELGCVGSGIRRGSVTETCSSAVDGAWLPTEKELRGRHLWFVNLNSQEDLRQAEDFLKL